MNKYRLSIDPGNEQSAYVLINQTETVPPTYELVAFGKIDNEELRVTITYLASRYKIERLVLEMVASYGMAVGKTVFETVLWAGRFYEMAEVLGIEVKLRYRKEVKIHLCHTMKAKDGNIIQALKDRFGDRGTKANPDFFYGVKADVWQAFALGITDFETE